MELTLLLNNIHSILQQSSHFPQTSPPISSVSSISFLHLCILVRQIFGHKYASLNSLLEMILQQESSHVIQSNVFVFLECWNQVLDWFRNEFPHVGCLQQVCGQDFLDMQCNSKIILPVLEWFLSQYSPPRKPSPHPKAAPLSTPSVPLPPPPSSPNSNKIKSLVQQFQNLNENTNTTQYKMKQIRKQNTSFDKVESGTIYDEDVAQKIQQLKMNFSNRTQSFSSIPSSTSPHSKSPSPLPSDPQRHASLTTQQISLLLQQQQQQQEHPSVDKLRHRSYTVTGLQPTTSSPLPTSSPQEIKIASPMHFQRNSVSISSHNLVSLQQSLSSGKLTELELTTQPTSTRSNSLPKEFAPYERFIINDVSHNIPLEKLLEARQMLTKPQIEASTAVPLLQCLFSTPQLAQQVLFFCREDESELRTLLSLFVNRRAVICYPHKIVPQTEKSFVIKYREFLWKEPKLFCRVLCTLCMPCSGPTTNLVVEPILAQEITQTWIPYYMSKCHLLSMEDVLEVLCCNSLTHEYASQLAVRVLQSNYSIQEVSLFVLQLVNTLRYESFSTVMQGKSAFFTFLLQLCQNQDTAMISNLFWYCTVECCEGNKNSHQVALIYQQFYQQFIMELKHHVNHQLAEWISKQQLLDGCLRKLSQDLKLDTSLTRNQKIAKLRGVLKLQGAPYYWEQLFTKQSVIILPCCHKPVVSMISGEAKIFKSAMEPLCLSFAGNQDDSIQLIYKNGDDLRQDQLILQMIRVIDVILKANQIDCCLTPYGVTATSFTSGFVELVPHSSTIASILGKYKSISQFFKAKAKEFYENQTADQKLSMEHILDGMMSQFVKSCAGYCVITYLLGIGDRHLDNLLIDHHGKFFHIDFGFICGKDPKPYPAPMRMTTEMIEGMGGMHSKYFVQFQTFACLIFKILRRYGNVLQLMMYCLMDANLPCLSGVQNVYNVRRTVDCRLRMDLSDKDSDKMILETLDYSVKMLAPKIMEQFHKLVQALRN